MVSGRLQSELQESVTGFFGQLGYRAYFVRSGIRGKHSPKDSPWTHAARAGALLEKAALRFSAMRVFWISLGLLACTRGPVEPPVWWEATAQSLARMDLLDHPIEAAEQSEGIPPYYQDSLGLTFRQIPPEGGVLWIEYWPDSTGRVRTLTLTWEHPEFARLARLYQLLRRRYEALYGPSTGPIGNQLWQRPDSTQLRLHLSPERRYLQLTCWQSRTFEP